MKTSLLLWSTGLVTLLSLPVLAQHNHGIASSNTTAPQDAAVTAPMPATSCTAPMIGYVPQEILERPVTLRPRLGLIKDKISTTSAEARAYYEQGLAYLHGYVWIEAARSFHQALRLDPKLAMAYVGLSMAYSNFEDYAASRQMAKKAAALAQEVSIQEQLRIEAQLARTAAQDSLHNTALLEAYRQALDKALAADMDNAELWLLRGNAAEAQATGIGQQGGIATIPYYEAAMARAPEHPAAYHYLIHTYENLGDFTKAEQHGKQYAARSPGIPHALHMYGHDLMKTGQIPAAIEYFGRADSLEQAYYDGEYIAPELDWHHGHNLSLLGMSHRYLGQTYTAERLFREMLELKPFFDEYAFMFKADLLALLLNQHRPKEVLAIVRSGINKNPLEQAFDEINAGRAYLLLNRVADAKAAKERAVAQMPGVATMLPNWPGFAQFYTQTYIDLLEGLILFHSPATRSQGALQLLKHGQTIRDVFRGPDQWIAGLYELEDLARLARSKGDWTLAADITNMLYAHDPHYPGSNYAKAIIAEKAGDKAGAQLLYSEAAQAWQQADKEHADAIKAHRKVKLAKK